MIPDLMRQEQRIYESAFNHFTERIELWLKWWEKENASPRKA